MRAGETGTLRLLACDEHCNEHTSGGGVTSVEGPAGTTCTFEDRGDGSYDISIRATQVQEFCLSVNGESLPRACVKVRPNVPHAATSRLANDRGLLNWLASDHIWVDLALFDEFSNAIPVESDLNILGIRALVDGESRPVRIDPVRSRVYASIGSCNVGQHVFTVSISGQTINGCPKQFTVRTSSALTVRTLSALRNQLRKYRSTSQFVLRLHRGDGVFEQAFRAFLRTSSAKLRGELRVVFHGESGIDEGGLSR